MDGKGCPCLACLVPCLTIFSSLSPLPWWLGASPLSLSGFFLFFPSSGNHIFSYYPFLKIFFSTFWEISFDSFYWCFCFCFALIFLIYQSLFFFDYSLENKILFLFHRCNISFYFSENIDGFLLLLLLLFAFHHHHHHYYYLLFMCQNLHYFI